LRLRETASEPVVVVFADADDVGVSRLVATLQRRLSTVWWRFGLPEGSVAVDVEGESFRLDQPGASLSSTDLHAAAVIVYRRRFLRPRPLVVSELPRQADRDFSEREWTSLIEGLLLVEEHESDTIWLNSPSSTLLTHNKLALLMHAARSGVAVPPFSVSSPVQFPQQAGGDLVVKSISTDERIDATRHFTTARLSSEDRRTLDGARLPTPSLLQEFVQAEIEVRVFYVLGEFFSLALTRSREHVDIRHVAHAELAPRPYDLAPELRSGLAGLADAFSLGCCTFDLLLALDGAPVLIDITPNGSWDYFESDAAPLVTEFLAEVIVARAASTTQRQK
jgi:hypothetical protein